MKRLTVRAISVQELEDLNAFVIALYDQKEMSMSWIEIQQPLTLNTQDQQLGLDTYCVTTNTGASHYGGITSCILRGRVLRIEFSQPAGSVLGLGEALECYLLVPMTVITSLRFGLERMLQNNVQCSSM